ncbi:MAG: lytic transglycosylase domain-containing protein [Rickettsiales bacterium]|jgi:soluble lytic murein transglycosylase-like protein|nr:lytic transglycosylase domain-containing protein [Rickettsiales bacterium]
MRKFAYLALALIFAHAAALAQAPGVLYDADLRTYKKVFELQAAGRMAEADKALKSVKSDVLMGYVLHQRYMSPYYTTKFSEARDWMRKYYDQPNATDIYKLGLRKGAKKELRPPKREASRLSFLSPAPSSGAMIQYSYTHLGKADRGQVNYMIKIFSRRLAKGFTKNAREIMENPQAKRLLARKDYLRMESHLAFAYFLNGEDDMAILWAREPASELSHYLANWTLGLVHWRAQEWEKSRDYFKAVAFERTVSADVISAGAYWAWRANSRIEERARRDDGDIFLSRAAEFPKTFYGILASTQSGRKLEINWDEPEFTLENSKEIVSWAGGIRALALLQLDMKAEAAAELKFLVRSEEGKDSAELISAVLAIAEQTDMPGLAMNVSQYISAYQDDATFASPYYPVLAAEPASGWRIDRALVNAVARQESRFNPMAKSGAGARGLMQIMPATASFITRDPGLRKKHRAKLFDESLNLEIGQMYIDYLLSSPDINGNLFKFLLAYNAGPGNMRKQETRIENAENDPLLFIESISIKESRIYIKRVMANLWIYRDRFKQESESLADLADGRWPIYSAKQCDWKPKSQMFELPPVYEPEEDDVATDDDASDAAADSLAGEEI